MIFSDPRLGQEGHQCHAPQGVFFLVAAGAGGRSWDPWDIMISMGYSCDIMILVWDIQPTWHDIFAFVQVTIDGGF